MLSVLYADVLGPAITHIIHVFQFLKRKFFQIAR